jgi:hypothetical protein
MVSRGYDQKMSLIPFRWESLGDGRYLASTHRAKVVGGWLVHSVVGDGSEGAIAGSMTFVPDPNHDWMIPPELEISAI